MRPLFSSPAATTPAATALAATAIPYGNRPRRAPPPARCRPRSNRRSPQQSFPTATASPAATTLFEPETSRR